MVALCQGYQAPKHWVPHAAPMCTALVLLGASLSPQPEEALRRTRSLEAWPRWGAWWHSVVAQRSGLWP